MNIRKLKALVAQGESETLEFKTSTAQLKPACETLCGFLNAKGGRVLIGVGSKGQIIGQHVTDSTHQEIANELRKIEPAVRIEVDYIKIADKQVIVMQAPAGKHIPYAYDGRAFERTLNSKGRMTQHHYEQLLIQRGQLNHSWEEYLANGYDLDSLDHEEILSTIQEGIRANRIPPSAIKDTVEGALKRFNLMDHGKLKNAAVVLFGKNLFSQYAQCELKLARFKGKTRAGDFLDNQQVYGNIFKLLSSADHFLMKHLPIASTFKENEFRRTDTPALPVLAIREAMVNALCHKNYTEQAIATTLAIYDDRLEIWNYGSLPRDLKISDLKKEHPSVPRNKLIANVLYGREFVEKWGTGTNKMINLCREYGVPVPKFEERGGGLAVAFKFKDLIGQPHAPSGNKIGISKPLNVRQKIILDIIKRHENIGIRQIVAELVNPPSQRTVQRDLEFLESQGLITHMGASQNSVWTLK